METAAVLQIASAQHVTYELYQKPELHLKDSLILKVNKVFPLLYLQPGTPHHSGVIYINILVIYL